MATENAMMIGAILAWGPLLLVFVYILRDLRNAPATPINVKNRSLFRSD